MSDKMLTHDEFRRDIQIAIDKVNTEKPDDLFIEPHNNKCLDFDDECKDIHDHLNCYLYDRNGYCPYLTGNNEL